MDAYQLMRCVGSFGLSTWLERLVADLLLRSPLVKLYDLEETIASDPPILVR